jgi:hypothetical protein
MDRSDNNVVGVGGGNGGGGSSGGGSGSGGGGGGVSGSGGGGIGCHVGNSGSPPNSTSSTHGIVHNSSGGFDGQVAHPKIPWLRLGGAEGYRIYPACTFRHRSRCFRQTPTFRRLGDVNYSSRNRVDVRRARCRRDRCMSSRAIDRKFEEMVGNECRLRCARVSGFIGGLEGRMKRSLEDRERSVHQQWTEAALFALRDSPRDAVTVSLSSPSTLFPLLVPLDPGT